MPRPDSVVGESSYRPEQATKNCDSFPGGNQPRRAWNGELCQVVVGCGTHTKDHLQHSHRAPTPCGSFSRHEACVGVAVSSHHSVSSSSAESRGTESIEGGKVN